MGDLQTLESISTRVFLGEIKLGLDAVTLESIGCFSHSHSLLFSFSLLFSPFFISFEPKLIVGATAGRHPCFEAARAGELEFDFARLGRRHMFHESGHPLVDG